MKNCEKCGGLISVFGENVGKCENCGALYSLRNGEYDAPDMESLYKEAVYDMGLDTQEYLSYAIEIFEKVGNYKDAKTRIQKCKEKIKEKDAEQAAYDHKVYLIKNYAKIIGGIALVVFLILFAVNSHRKKIYNQAMEFYNNYCYEEALVKFEKLGDYSDASRRVIEVTKLIEERDTAYDRGYSYYSAEQYDKAITEFSKCLYYKDSKELYEESAQKLFEQAEAYSNNEEYDQAIAVLSVIPEDCGVYNDSLVLMTSVSEARDAKIQADNYELARSYYEQGQYDKAQRLFIELGNYVDSQNYLNEIGSYYYGLANTAYLDKDFNTCASMLEYIDSVEEWNQYRESQNLRTIAGGEYIELLKEVGKQISRADGYTAMVSYVDSMNNSLLTSEDINMIKEYCTIITVSLTDIYSFSSEGGGLYEANNDEDSMGNVHQVILWATSKASQSYNLNGEYCIFRTIISISPGSANDSHTTLRHGSISIYGDNGLLYTESLDKYTLPHEICLDVTGISTLRIDMAGEDWSTLGDFVVYLCDPMLSN